MGEWQQPIPNQISADNCFINTSNEQKMWVLVIFVAPTQGSLLRLIATAPTASKQDFGSNVFQSHNNHNAGKLHPHQSFGCHSWGWVGRQTSQRIWAQCRKLGRVASCSNNKKSQAQLTVMQRKWAQPQHAFKHKKELETKSDLQRECERSLCWSQNKS